MGIIDPNKKNEDDFIKNMYDKAVDTVTAPSSMVHNPGVAIAGLGVGAVKNFTDMVALPLSVGQQAVNYLSGKGAVKPEDDIFKKYEEASQNLAIDIGSGGKRDQLSATELQDARKAAAGAEFLGSFIGMHGSPKILSKVPHGEVLKGGAPAILGNFATKINVGTKKVISRGAVTLPDVIFQGMAKVQETGKKVLKPQGEILSDLSSIINPKTATNIIAAKAPEAIVALSEAYNTPIAKMQDLGDPLLTKFKETNNLLDVKNQIGVPEFVKKEVDSIAGLKEIDPQAKALIVQELTKDLREKHGLEGSRVEAQDTFNSIIEGHKTIKTLEKKLSNPNEPITDIERAKINKQILDQAEHDPMKLERFAKELRKHKEDDYIKASIDPTNNLSMENLQKNLIDERQKIYDQLYEVDPRVALNFDKASTQSYVGRVGQLGNLFKAEPLFGDFTQINEALPLTLLKSAEKLGVEPLVVAGHKRTFSKWYSDPKVKDVITKTVIEPNRTQFDSIYQMDSTSKVGKKSITDQIMDTAADVGMSNQIQFRQRLIESLMIPEAYALVKAYGEKTGTIKEGTLEFNNAVINHVKNYIEESGMIPPEMSQRVYTDRYGKTEIRKGFIDNAQTELNESLKKMGGLGKEAAGASNFMLKWVRGATQAKLKAWNLLNESLEHITRTGKVTDTQKMIITNSVIDLVAGTILFGGRGVRIPGLVTETPTNALGSEESPDTLGSYITGAISTFLKLNPEAARELKDGLFYKMTGLSSARINNMPLPTLGQGNEIFTSIVTKKFGPLLSHIFTKGLTSEYYSSREIFSDLVGMFVSQDTEIASDIGATGQRYDAKGKPIIIDEEKHIFAHAVGVDMTKNTPGKDPLQGDTTYTKAQKNVVNRYSRLELKDLLNGDTLDTLLDDLEEVYPGNATKITTTVKKLIRDKLVPDSGDIFANLAAAASIATSSGNYGISKEDSTLRNLTDDQVIEMAALSQITQGSSKSVRNLLIESGRLNTDDEKVMDKLVKKIIDIQNKVDKSLEE